MVVKNRDLLLGLGVAGVAAYFMLKPSPPPPGQYALSILAGDGGSTEPPSGSYNYDEGTEVTVTAIPDAGYSFDHWILNGVLYHQNPITIGMVNNATLEPFFEEVPPPPPGKATIHIDTVPVKGQIYIDGQYIGMAPQYAEVDPGDHSIRFGAVSGYVTPSSLSATVEEGDTITVKATYEPELSIEEIREWVYDQFPSAREITAIESGILGINYAWVALGYAGYHDIPTTAWVAIFTNNQVSTHGFDFTGPDVYASALIYISLCQALGGCWSTRKPLRPYDVSPYSVYRVCASPKPLGEWILDEKAGFIGAAEARACIYDPSLPFFQFGSTATQRTTDAVTINYQRAQLYAMIQH